MTRTEISLEKKKKKKARIKKWAIGIGTTVGLPLLGGFLEACGSGIGEALVKALQHLIIS